MPDLECTLCDQIARPDCEFCSKHADEHRVDEVVYVPMLRSDATWNAAMLRERANEIAVRASVEEAFDTDLAPGARADLDAAQRVYRGCVSATMEAMR